MVAPSPTGSERTRVGVRWCRRDHDRGLGVDRAPAAAGVRRRLAGMVWFEL
jgi:hypothetical protein